MIFGFPKFPRICSRFCLLILYSNIRLIVLYQFSIWSCWMFSYDSHIWAWMLFRKRHNEFLFLDFLRLLWYLLGTVHYWLDIFRRVGISVFLYRKNILITINGKIRNGNHKNEMGRKHWMIWTKITVQP